MFHNRAVLARSGNCRPPDRVRHAAGENNASVKSKIRRVGAKFWPKNVFWPRPTDPAGTRHWFPADGIGCLPFWLVVSSGAHVNLDCSIFLLFIFYCKTCCYFSNVAAERPDTKTRRSCPRGLLYITL